jgi:hypothetical protein
MFSKANSFRFTVFSDGASNLIDCTVVALLGKSFGTVMDNASGRCSGAGRFFFFCDSEALNEPGDDSGGEGLFFRAGDFKHGEDVSIFKNVDGNLGTDEPSDTVCDKGSNLLKPRRFAFGEKANFLLSVVLSTLSRLLKPGSSSLMYSSSDCAPNRSTMQSSWRSKVDAN